MPHSHDYSELEGAANELVHHDHDHHNHGHDGAHAHHDEHGEDWLSFFIDLFEGLEHSNLESGQFEDYVITDARFKQDFSVIDVSDDNPIVTPVIATYTIDFDETVNYTDPPPILKEHLKTCSEPLRGPPSIS